MNLVLAAVAGMYYCLALWITNKFVKKDKEFTGVNKKAYAVLDAGSVLMGSIMLVASYLAG